LTTLTPSATGRQTGCAGRHAAAKSVGVTPVGETWLMFCPSAGLAKTAIWQAGSRRRIKEGGQMKAAALLDGRQSLTVEVWFCARQLSIEFAERRSAAKHRNPNNLVC
jgi:hypothetical protein